MSRFSELGITDISSIGEDEPKSVLLYDGGGNTAPKYSIIMPTYKREERMLKSLRSAINQTYDNFEIVLVDNDDNFDNTKVLELVKAENCDKIRYFKHEKNIGAEPNFNRGAQLARGEYIAWLHDDDFWELDFLATVDKKIKGDRAIFTAYNIVNEDESLEHKEVKQRLSLKGIIKRVGVLLLRFFHAVNLQKNTINSNDLFKAIVPVGCIGNVYNREALISVGGFNHDFYPGTDYELNSRYVSHFGGYFINERVANYVVSANDSLTSCVLFPTFNYDLRVLMMERGMVRNTSKNQELAKVLYARDMDSVNRLWHADPKKNEINLEEYSKKIWSTSMRLFIKGVVKYGETKRNNAKN